jgi:hypothetical protein
MLISQTVTCPYCGEHVEIEVDPTGGRKQDYEQDCEVCCRPWKVHVKIDGDGDAWVRISSQDDVDNED